MGQGTTLAKESPSQNGIGDDVGDLVQYARRTAGRDQCDRGVDGHSHARPVKSQGRRPEREV